MVNSKLTGLGKYLTGEKDIWEHNTFHGYCQNMWSRWSFYVSKNIQEQM